MIIYKATNTTNNKVYIGQTIRTLSQRKGNHYSPKELHDTSYFHNSLLKYERKLWIWEIIDRATSIDELNLKEQYWIGFYKSNIREFGYNLSNGGLNNIKSEETCKKISESLTGREFSEEHKLHIKEDRKNQIFTDETKEKMSKVHLGEKHWNHGKHWDDNVKKKISDSSSGEKHFMYGKKHNSETIEKMKLNNKHTKNPKYIYTIINPEGIKYETEDLNLFCTNNNLRRNSLTMCFYQKTTEGHTYKGWKISRIKKSDIKQ